MSTIRFSTIIGPDQLIRPPEGVHLPPGEAEVIIVQQPLQRTASESAAGSLRDRLARAAAELGIPALPADLAENHDHYSHGTAKGIDRP
jgi:hypothetical protein